MDVGQPVWRLLVVQGLDSRLILKDKLTGFPDVSHVMCQRKKWRLDDAEVDFI